MHVYFHTYQKTFWMPNIIYECGRSDVLRYTECYLIYFLRPWSYFKLEFKMWENGNILRIINEKSFS